MGEPKFSEIPPLLSVCMLAYNVEPYVAQAIEGVLSQQTPFVVELLIGEDCSTDGTRAVCVAYAEKYPDRVRVLPPEKNLGIAGNAARTLRECRGKYIAICDGDDRWTDPFKLRDQVEFLEKNPDYGAAYSDVQTISEHGTPVDDPEHADIRLQYASGDLFFKLLQGNFINNSTAVFRTSLLEDYEIDTDRHYYTHDHLLWLHVSIHSKIHFDPRQTTQYRKHSGGVTNSAEKLANNKRKFQFHLSNILRDFDRNFPRPLNAVERMFIFQKLLSVLIRKENNWGMKLHALGLAPKYFPGMVGLARLLLGKIGWQFVHTLHDNIITTNLESNA